MSVPLLHGTGGSAYDELLIFGGIGAVIIDLRVRLRFLDDDLGEPLISLRDTGAGIWRHDDTPLNIAGNYQAEVVVRRPDAFDARTAFRFNARSTAAAADAIRPDTDTVKLLFGLKLAIIGGLVLVIGFRGHLVNYLRAAFDER